MRANNEIQTQFYTHLELVLLTDVGGPLFEAGQIERIRVGLDKTIIETSEDRHQHFRTFLRGRG